MRRYVILEQDAMHATVFVREAERWVGSLHSGPAVLEMPELDITLPLAELYEGVTPAGAETAKG